MQIYTIIRSFFKVFLSILSFSVLLTTIIGGLSIFQVLATPNNISVDPDNVDMSFGATGNHFSMELTFNNEGYFPFENFSVITRCTFINKSSSENFTIIDSVLFQDTLEGSTLYNIPLEADNSDFTVSELLADNQNSWHDPDVQLLIDNGTISEQDAESLSYPYLLWNYDVVYELRISSKYNLGLIAFSLNTAFTVIYDDYFTQSYPTIKDSLIGGL